MMNARLILNGFIVCLIVCSLPSSRVLSETHSNMKPNRLVNSGSPYLLQHARNPVDWYPWGEEAFKKAKAENKPIFLSVGYSTCYWCHVAERTIYADPDIARLMNRWFVNVKVDREERPDVDEIYMLARQILSGGGGWPNNLFLTPDLKPFFAGSYFPPKDHKGQMGFPSLLKYLHGVWVKNSGEILAIADNVHTALLRVSKPGKGAARGFNIDPKSWRATARTRILSRFDSFEGGFNGGDASKFPQSPLLNFLIEDFRLSKDKSVLSAVDATLRAIAYGGIHDHIGGGVHRYATEPSWSVPHFEKMLFDNAQLLDVYTAYYAQTRAPFAGFMVHDIVAYLQTHMTSQGGGFFTAEDADIDGREGESYLWTRAEITKILGDARALRFFSLYELTALPEAPLGPGVLRVRKDLISEVSKRGQLLKLIKELGPMRRKLLAIRRARRQPARDDKVVVVLNGLAVAALARAGGVFHEREWIDMASRAGEFMWRQAYNEKTGKPGHQLSRYLFKGKAWGKGFLEDYASLGLGFLALDNALGAVKGERVWRARARELARVIEERLMTAEGVVVTRVGGGGLIVPAIDLQDGDTPSGTSLAFELFHRLGLDDPQYAKTAGRLLHWMAPKIAAVPDAWVSFLASIIRSEKSGAMSMAGVGGTATGGAGVSPTSSAPHVIAHGVGSQIGSGGNGGELIITLKIAKGYHINANPASKDFLVPTRVILPEHLVAKITYPRSREFKTKFVDEGILVYEGEVLINVDLASGGLDALKKSLVKIEVQACTEKVCLEPSVIPVSLEFDK